MHPVARSLSFYPVVITTHYRDATFSFQLCPSRNYRLLFLNLNLATLVQTRE